MCKAKGSKSKGSSARLPSLRKFPEWMYSGRNWFILFTGLFLSVLHSLHISSMFENDRHFSHLSTLEREMTFRTEMGLYYSYFKTMIEAPDALTGLNLLYQNDLTEYPKTINTLKRFNLYPEVALGFLFRIYNQTTEMMGYQTKICYRIDRGEYMSPVQSCEGMGDPAYFYLQGVWICGALTAFFIYLLGIYLSDSIFGGFLAIDCFFFNHGECTRIQWTPPLRESFAFPFWLAQLYFVSVTLKSKSTIYFGKQLLGISLTTTIFIVTWQFAQFVLLTQLYGLFLLYSMGFIKIETFQLLLTGLLIGLLNSVILMFGNEMLFTSWFFSAIFSALIVTLILDEHIFNRLGNFPIIKVPLQLFSFTSSTVFLKIYISRVLGVRDDAHVFDILKSKFTDFSTFHTLLYTCTKEFDFLGWEMPWKCTLTLLVPSCAVAVGVVIYRVFPTLKRKLQIRLGEEETKKDISVDGIEDVDPAILYNIIQCVAFMFMASIIMRLKLFLTPQLCVLSGLLASKKLFDPSGSHREKHYGLVFLLLALMSVQGLRNVYEQRSILGEYSDPHMEELIEWINESTPPDASFGGSMALMANILLSTRRPVVNHPHYEDTDLRKRTKEIYKMYSRRSLKEYYPVLRSLKINYLVLSSVWCLNSETGDGCGMTDLWDIEEPERLGQTPLCKLLWNTPSQQLTQVKRVFSNDRYVVLQIPNHIVEVEPPKHRSQ